METHIMHVTDRKGFILTGPLKRRENTLYRTNSGSVCSSNMLVDNCLPLLYIRVARKTKQLQENHYMYIHYFHITHKLATNSKMLLLFLCNQNMESRSSLTRLLTPHLTSSSTLIAG